MKRKRELHGVPLLPDRVAISFGLPIPPAKGYDEAMRISFPNAKSVILGGCVVDFESGPDAEVFYCPECRKALEDWELTNR